METAHRQPGPPSAPEPYNLFARTFRRKVVGIERIVGKRLAVALVLSGLAGFGAVAAIDQGEGGGRVAPMVVAAPAIGARPVNAASPVVGHSVGSGRIRTESAKATVERLVAAVDQALRESVPAPTWTGPRDRWLPGHLHREGRDGSRNSATVGTRLVHQGRDGTLHVTINLDPAGAPAPFDWSCRDADRRRGAMCEASREPDGVRTKIQTSVGAGGIVRHRVDVELPDVGRLRLDVSNDSGIEPGRPVQPDAPLGMEEARAVALNVSGRIAS
ncbi:hypothetical protein ACGF7U_19665 [Micromonospora sp. NPDC047670]|uniref:hypothetical protein n=1 Tax=Micromonospora sp. NPDC047670 TaxID=3364252 RepID=UPI003719B88D